MRLRLELDEAEALMALEAVARRVDQVEAAAWMAARERDIRLRALWSVAAKIRVGLSEGQSNATDGLCDAG